MDQKFCIRKKWRLDSLVGADAP